MFEYVVPGDGVAGYCLATGRFLLAAADGLQSRIPRLWSLLRDPDTRFEDVFDSLAGREISAMPAFAMIEILDEASRIVRTLVHGDAIAEAQGVSGGPISGAGLATWRDATWHEVEGVMIGLGSMRTGVETLPVVAGVVRADWIRWRPEVRTPHRIELAIQVDGGPPIGLAHPLVLGRRPESALADLDAATVPVVVDSPRRLISAAHLLVERDGDRVLIRDLGAKNGSLIRTPEGSSLLLRERASCTVPVGTTIELGGETVLTIVVQPRADD